MPELPEVQTVLDGVTKQLGSLKILALESYYPSTVRNYLTQDDVPFPARMISSIRRGKYMILNLESGYSLLIHLRMTGKLVWDKDVPPVHIHERAALMVENGYRLRFIDPRTFGKITLCHSSEVSAHLPSLGAEPLENGFNPSYLKEKLKNRSIPIKTALLDQSTIAGLGNIYVCEILYRAGLNPDTPAKQISEPRLKKIVNHTKDVLAEAITHNGTSISDFRRVDDKKGGFQDFLRVYQKQTCPKGHHIQKLKHGGRSTYYCPECQNNQR